MVNEDECRKAGLDIKKVASIARRISKAAREAEEIGIIIFGGSGSGSLRFNDKPDELEGRPLVLAYLDGCIDGGDGACWEDDDGLMRGE